MASSTVDPDIIAHDWYSILELPFGADETKIAKSIRKLSLKYHPDKNSDADAPKFFLQVQKAKEILLDVDKRKIYDGHIQSIAKRKEYDTMRDKNMDQARKKMKQDLENRMKEALAKSNASSSSSAKSSNSATDKINRENQAFKEEYKSYERELERERELNREPPKPKPLSQIKVKWRKSQESHSDESLYQMFKKFGEIVSISVAAHSAIISFNSLQQCYKAIDEFMGSNDFRVSLLTSEYKGSNTQNNIFTHDYSSNTNKTETARPRSSVESMLADDIHRAVEREAYLRKLEKEEEAGVIDMDSMQSDSDFRPKYQSTLNNDCKWPPFDENENVTLEEIEECENLVFELLEKLGISIDISDADTFQNI